MQLGISNRLYCTLLVYVMSPRILSQWSHCMRVSVGGVDGFMTPTNLVNFKGSTDSSTLMPSLSPRGVVGHIHSYRLHCRDTSQFPFNHAGQQTACHLVPREHFVCSAHFDRFSPTYTLLHIYYSPLSLPLSVWVPV